MQPVKASGWIDTKLADEERSLLKIAGITPVNDVFYPLWGNENKINLLYGGYGSGKSVFIQTLLLHQCQTNKYFKCFFGRKVFEDVRGSVHSKFVSLIEDLKLTGFKYSKEPNGSMIITHKNGGKFIPFGASKADGLKSIDDPTHFFLEEMDQFTLDDFGVILSRLRTNKALTQLYGAFNTEKVMPEHWIRRVFFKSGDDIQTETERELIEKIDSMGVSKTFCNYTDNYFIDQEDYYNKLVIAAAGDVDKLNASARGDWGSYKPVNPFATQYNRSHHESVEAKLRPQSQLILSFDFNLNPFCAIAAHIFRDDKGEHCHIFDEFSIEAGSIPKMCDAIRTRYGKMLHNCVVTGDSMGKKRDLGQSDNASHYLQIQRLLHLSSNQFKLPNNPTHENSREDVNYFLYHFPDFKINPKTCPNTCRDMRMVQCDAYGSIIKKNRKDESQQADMIDCVRYLINTFLKPWINSHQKIIRR